MSVPYPGEPIDAAGGYRAHEYWKHYQPFFPERMRLSGDRLPSESWWEWCGARIHLDRHEPPDAKLTVLLLHGGGGHGRLLGPIGVMLAERGYACVAPDLPGYGLSDVRPELFTHHAWVDCCTTLVEAEIEHTGRPVVLFGLSLGGYLAYQVAARSRRTAGIIVTTLADPRRTDVRDAFSNIVLSRVGLPIMMALGRPFERLRLPIRWVCKMEKIANDPALSEIVCRDPLGGGNVVTVGFLRSLMEMKPDVEFEDFDLCPVLLAHPGDDRWTPTAVSTPTFDRIRGPKELVILENCGHVPVEEPGVRQFEEAVGAFLGRVTT